MEVSTASFAARARVIDLLGREQIADAPTAISELLKNAIDAGADEAQIRYETTSGCLQIEDDGLGMRLKDLLGKWLVLATDSKRGEPDTEWLATASPEQVQQIRTNKPLGEKGIGRLAAAHLGRGVFIWTRWGIGAEAQRTLMFIHWSLFQHPRLSLDDIVLPYLQLNDTVATETDGSILLKQLRIWMLQHRRQWKADGQRALWHEIMRDLRKIFPQCLKSDISYFGEPGTLFCIMGTTIEVENIFAFQRESNEDTEVSEGFKSLLGFCDPFSATKPRLKVSYTGNNENSQVVRDFWKPEDFAHADHEIDLTVNATGYVQGLVRRNNETFNYSYQLQTFLARSRFPGPFRLKLGYVPGAGYSSLTPDEHTIFNRRLEAFGALYVYRDGIRVLPYGRIDSDFLGFEERRTFNAGRYFFSHRRMFGAVYIDSEHNLELRDKAGREGFIKNATYRGFRNGLREIFLDLADTYFGSKSDRDDEKNSTREAKNKDAAEKARERVKRETQAFLRDFEIWRRRIPVFERELTQLFQVAENRLSLAERSGNLGNVLPECYAATQSVRAKITQSLSEIGSDIPAVVNLTRSTEQAFDVYLTERQQFQQQGTRRLAAITARYDRLAQEYLPEKQRIEQIQSRIDDVAGEYKRCLQSALVDFQAACQIVSNQSAPQRLNDNLAELQKILDDAVGPEPARYIAADKTGDMTKRLEAALLSQQTRVRDVHLPFWALMKSNIESLDTAESGELAIGALNRELEAFAERTGVFAELAQVGLAVESIDHDFKQLFRNIQNDLTTVRRSTSGDEGITTLLRLSRSFESLEQRLRFLDPIFRVRQGSADLKGDEVAKFIDDIYPVEVRGSIEILYSSRFRSLIIPSINTSVVFAACTNIVANSLYWVTQTPPPRRVGFSIVSNGFAISDTGPGIAPRDRERIFQASFGRRPEGRGLGLYIAKTALEASGLTFTLAEDNPKGSLPGACFLIQLLPKG